jgi:hypothetical protein
MKGEAEMANITAHWVSVRNDAEDMYHCYSEQSQAD